MNKINKKDNTITCDNCGKVIDLNAYSINPHSHVINTIMCECGHQLSFIPDEDCHIIKQKPTF